MFTACLFYSNTENVKRVCKFQLNAREKSRFVHYFGENLEIPGRVYHLGGVKSKPLSLFFLPVFLLL